MTETQAEPAAYDIKHYQILQSAALDAGWSVAKLADRLNEIGVGTNCARNEADELRVVSLFDYNAENHHKMLEELSQALKEKREKVLADREARDKQAKLEGLEVMTELHFDTLVQIAEDAKLNAKWVRDALVEQGAKFSSGHQYPIVWNKAQFAVVQHRALAQAGYNAVVAKAELNGISAEEVLAMCAKYNGGPLDELRLKWIREEVDARIEASKFGKVQPEEKKTLSAGSATEPTSESSAITVQADIINGGKPEGISLETAKKKIDQHFEKEIARLQGDIDEADQRASKFWFCFEKEAEILGIGSTPNEAQKDAEATIRKATGAGPQPDTVLTIAPCTEALYSAIKTFGTDVRWEIQDEFGVLIEVEEKAKTKGKKKTEPKPPKEPKAPKAKPEKVVDQEPELEISFGDNKPENLIPHVFRRAQLETDFAAHSAQFERNWEDAGVRLVRFSVTPEGINWYYELGDGVVLSDAHREELERNLQTFAEVNSERGAKCYLHVLDFMKLQRRREREIMEIKADVAAVEKRLKEKLEGLQACYGSGFRDWIEAQLNHPSNITADGAYKAKNIKTIAGTIEVRKSGGVTVSSKQKLDDHLLSLNELATNTGWKSWDDGPDKEAQRQRCEDAQMFLACLPVRFERVEATQAIYSTDEIKELFDAGIDLPGLLKTEVRELGSISIKAGKLIEDAEEE